EDGIRDATVTGVQTCALPISRKISWPCSQAAASTMALPCAGTSIALLALENWLNRAVALSRSAFTVFKRSSRKSRSRRAAEVLRSEERRVGKGGRGRWVRVVM